MSSKADRLRAELELAEAEEAFVAAKAAQGKDLGAYVEAKYTLRELRQAYREEHRQSPSGPGAATAKPAAIEGKVSS